MRRVRLLLVLMLVCVLAAAAAAAAMIADDGGEPPRVVAIGTPDGERINDLYRRLSPGVMFIQAQIVQVQQSPFGPPRRRSGVSTGTGFVIDEQGHVVTNAHVVENAEQLRLRIETSWRSSTGSPAARAGIRAAPTAGGALVAGGDVIVRIGDREITGPDVAQAVLDREVGSRIEVVVVRDGQRRTLAVTLGTRPLSRR